MTACRWLCTTMVALVFWIASTRSGCTCCHLHCCDIFKMRERKSKRSIEMKSWTVTRVIMWHLCQNGVEASKDWVSVAHFNHLFNTPMPRTVTDVPRSPDVTLLKQAGWYPWAVRLWICGRGPTMYSKLMSRMHACLQMYVPMHNTFKAPGQWKT